MSFPRYPEYKSSKIDWLGVVPAHWVVRKFRYCFQESAEKIECDVIGPMLSVSGYRGIEVKEYDDENRKRTDEELVGYRIVRPGQLVVNTMWLNYAGLGVSDHQGHVSPAYRSYNINDGLKRRFVHHLMRCEMYVKGYTKFLTGIRPNSLQMSREDLMGFPVLIPPILEQAAIADFLDRETTKIDALVAEQERLIELLKEKQQAVISHAVTRGLNPDAPMKPSGIEWLGDVPTHWRMTAVRRIATRVETGRTPPITVPSEELEDGLPWYTPGDFLGETKLAGSSKSVLRQSVELGDVKAFPAGSVLIVSIGTLGKVGFAPTVSSSNQQINAVVPIRDVDGLFLTYALAARTDVMRSLSNASTIGILNQEKTKEIVIAVPPLQEQRAIATMLEQQGTEIADLIAEAKKSIALLHQRRAALISAAVTGQIDVRGPTRSKVD